MSRCSYDTVGPRAKGKRVGVKSRRWLGVRKRQSRASLQVIGTSVVVRGPQFVHCYLLRPAIGAVFYTMLFNGKGILNAQHGYNRRARSVHGRATRRHGGGEAGNSGRVRQTQSIKSIAGVRLFWRRLEAATAFC
jgi:hypothetical protein